MTAETDQRLRGAEGSVADVVAPPAPDAPAAGTSDHAATATDASSDSPSDAVTDTSSDAVVPTEPPLDDAGRFERLVADLHGPLLAYLLRRTDRDTAADVLGDVLLVLWRRRDDVPADAALPWSYGVARRCLANARRGLHRREALLARLVVLAPPRPVEGPEGVVDVTDLDVALRDAMVRLNPTEAEVLTLWAWENLTPGEIAVALGVTPNAVSIRLHRAKAHLREWLEFHDAKGQNTPRTRQGRGEEER